ncbi:spore cortex biosynthesis protein YabQ [Clostridium argentinense CDC 2741]|uniref:Spore cortex biosynthesis protein YabQ n=2 Tax=Clostridium argentinense TaxID=29341 RepID=A0A0C1UED4_9CLOT|nr:spore cortex biosynthesis protein YabQ [Clostridium argentinense]KIE45760.1 spore cortex biosynthesis protein YabQ [Clostridium argentinense CDC 2741]ARC83615.1 spore cortex biosynthesis protein YabQ [Clostridium argentinense]NFF40499.1 spore cortex biosynthesis protein YabQ [Clostridium argentinense]NFP50817.1 spore cortex biosynthesis protein YabQ [Clostridium argentinense]NFP74134.1 spore cortex biosynthesis protein YabQ [Clostridium argentinense]
MLFTMEQQIILFVFSLLSGVLIGVLFDIYRIIRGVEDVGAIITIIQDILFWIATGFIVFIFMMYTSYAYMSFNVFVYVSIGLFVYIKLISKIFINVLHNVLVAIGKVLRVIFNTLSYPVRFCLYKIIGKS